MSAILKRSLWLGLGALVATAAAGCEVVDCDKNPEKEVCQDDPEEDGGDSWEDADTPEADASLDGGGSDSGRDGGTSDAGDARADGSSSDGGTADGGDASSSEPLTISEFCIAQQRVAVAWRNELEGLCGTTGAVDERDTFLSEVFAYPAEDAEGKCINTIEGLVNAGNTTFDGSKAQACADKFVANYDDPPVPFPTDGIDLSSIEATVGHGAPQPVQITECRAAVKGKLTRDKVCTNSLECADGLRCLAAPGGTLSCQPALTGGTCTRTGDCADSYICVGVSSGAGKTCVKNDQLVLNGGNCSFSLECAEGLVCNASNKCANPTAQVICKP